MKKSNLKLLITTLLVGVGSMLFTREKIDLLWFAFALCGSSGIALTILWNPKENMEVKNE